MAIIMSKPILTSALESLSQQWATLLQKWQREKKIPVGAVSLLIEIFHHKPTPLPVTDEDAAMLSLVVSEALQGINIAQKYPGFFLRLIENQTLLEDFLDSFDILLRSKEGALEPLPSPASLDLSFLRQRSSPPPVVERVIWEGWRVTWQQTIEQLQAFFFPPPMSLSSVTRRLVTFPVDEDDWFTLFRQETKIGDTFWTVLLEGTPNDDVEVALSLQITIVPTGNHRMQVPLKATLSWGDYQAQVMVTSGGRAEFPPLLLNKVLDMPAETVTAGLQVTVEAINSQTQ